VKSLLNIIWDTVVRLGVVIGILAALFGILQGTTDIKVYTAVEVLSEPEIIVAMDPDTRLQFALTPHLHDEWHKAIEEHNAEP